MTDGKQITTLLLRKYPEPKPALHYSNLLELLVAVILSAQCTDARVNEVTATLFTNAMILHGRETCTARNPRCGSCMLLEVCPWPDKRKYSGQPTG